MRKDLSKPSNIDNSIPEKSVEAGSVASWFLHKQIPDGEVHRSTKDDIANPYALPSGTRFLPYDNMMKQGPGSRYEIESAGVSFRRGIIGGACPNASLERLVKVGRAVPQGKCDQGREVYGRFSSVRSLNNVWTDTGCYSRRRQNRTSSKPKQNLSNAAY